MVRIVEVKPLAKFKIWVRFQDRTQGWVDVSDLAGKGVFSKWKEPGFFETVFIDKESHTVAWPGGIDLAPESLYEEVAGRSPLKTSRA